MCTLFANLYMLSTWCPHMVYMGCPYIFYIYMIKCGWLGNLFTLTLSVNYEVLRILKSAYIFGLYFIIYSVAFISNNFYEFFTLILSCKNSNMCQLDTCKLIMSKYVNCVVQLTTCRIPPHVSTIVLRLLISP